MISDRVASRGKGGLLALRSERADLAVAFLLFIAVLLVYLRTLAPDLVDADGGEFQFAAWNFSLVHPTGYPLYLVLGGLFQHLFPVGNPAFRLNLFTAITASLTVTIVYFVLRELWAGKSAAVIGAGALAISRVFWYDANAAEVYSMNAFFLAVLLLIAFRWEKSLTARSLTVFALVFGLALTHHRSVLLWVPGFGVFLALFVQHLKTLELPRNTARVALAFFAPFLLYLYIPLRAAATPYRSIVIAPGNELSLFGDSIPWFVDYFLGRRFQFEIGWDSTSMARLAGIPQSLLDQFGALGIGLGILGLGVMAARGNVRQLSLLVLGAATTVIFAAAYHIGDFEHYFIPAYLVWALAIGIGCDQLIRRAGRYLQSGAFAGVLAVAVLVPMVWMNLPMVDRSGEDGRANWERILGTSIPRNAILLSNDRDEVMPLWYMQFVESRRTDLAALFPLIDPAPQYSNIATLTDQVLDSGRPVYYIKPMNGLDVKFLLDSAYPALTRVVGRSSDKPAQVKTDTLLGGSLRVTGYRVARDGSNLTVSVYWVPQVRLTKDYVGFVHLQDINGNKVAQGNDHRLGGEFYPTSLWQIGETLVDHQTINLPAGLPPGRYTLLEGMYGVGDLEPIDQPVTLGTLDLP